MQNCSHIKDDIEGNDMLLIVSVSINMILLIVNIPVFDCSDWFVF